MTRKLRQLTMIQVVLKIRDTTVVIEVAQAYALIGRAK